MDYEAVAIFISETAFYYAPYIAGAVLGFTILLIVVLTFRNHLLQRLQ